MVIKTFRDAEIALATLETSVATLRNKKAEVIDTSKFLTEDAIINKLSELAQRILNKVIDDIAERLDSIPSGTTILHKRTHYASGQWRFDNVVTFRSELGGILKLAYGPTHNTVFSIFTDLNRNLAIEDQTAARYFELDPVGQIMTIRNLIRFRPYLDNAIDLGVDTNTRFKKLWIYAIDAKGNILPQADNAFTLGTAGTLAWLKVSAYNYRFEAGTASRAIATDANKDLVSSATTATELGYLSGVTSAIQTQITAKAAKGTPGAHTITLLKLTGGGTDGSITWNADGVVTNYVDPT